MIKKEFKNEAGNPITIKVKNKSGTAKNHKSGEAIKFSGVCLSIIGPTSIAEWNITDVEAKKLHSALGQFIAKNKL